MKFYLEGGLVKIKKEIIHQAIGYPTLERVNTMRCTMRNIIKDQTKAK